MKRLNQDKMSLITGGKMSSGSCALLGAAVVINFWVAYYYSAEISECWNS